jgi:hypothetical protein
MTPSPEKVGASASPSIPFELGGGLAEDREVEPLPDAWLSTGDAERERELDATEEVAMVNDGAEMVRVRPRRCLPPTFLPVRTRPQINQSREGLYGCHVLVAWTGGRCNSTDVDCQGRVAGRFPWRTCQV